MNTPDPTPAFIKSLPFNLDTALSDAVIRAIDEAVAVAKDRAGGQMSAEYASALPNISEQWCAHFSLLHKRLLRKKGPSKHDRVPLQTSLERIMSEVDKFDLSMMAESVAVKLRGLIKTLILGEAAARRLQQEESAGRLPDREAFHKRMHALLQVGFDVFGISNERFDGQGVNPIPPPESLG